MGIAYQEPIDVVVTGAGPTGLSLAIQLRQMGASVRIVEKVHEPRPHTPALAIHPRTIEVLGGLSVADAIIERGVSRVDLRLHFPGSEILGHLDELGFADTRYPFILFVQQPCVEEEMRLRLAGLDTEVEWGKRLDSFTEDGNRVISHLVTADGGETIASRYLVGCDGADSTVRRGAGIGFIGRPYRQSLLVADVAPTDAGADTATEAFFGAEGILFLFPLPSGYRRLVAVRPAGVHIDDPLQVVEKHVPGLLRTGDLVWHRQVKPQRRIARRYRRSRLFLAGDAAHVHSPAGALGMNTGIQDAVNLGWKLALACRGDDAVLDTYEQERRPVAIRNILVTELAFMVEASGTWPFRFARTVAGPPVARLVIRYPAIMRRLARVVSGLDIRYRIDDSGRPPLPGLPAPGRRLPDPAPSGTGAARLHEILNGSGFSLFSFGDAPDSGALAELMERYGNLVAHHHFAGCPWVKPAPPLTCLVRPDGYIATWGGPGLAEVRASLERMTGRAPAPLSITSDL